MRLILLRGGRCAKVDDEDYGFLSNYPWHMIGSRYVGTNIWQQIQDANRKPVGPRFRIRRELSSEYMHRIIMRPRKGIHVDHVNGDGLDNRRSNLRLCRQWQNAANRGFQRNNTTGFKGVCPRYGRYRARIQIKGKYIYLGMFDTPEEAAAAYDCAVLHHFGEFAVTNASLRA